LTPAGRKRSSLSALQSMQKNIIWVIVVIVAVVVIYYAYGFLKNGSLPETPAGTPLTTGSGNASEVLISNFSFEPKELTISRGTTVRWTNRDNVNHPIVSDEGVFQSGALMPGGTFEFAFDSAGEFSYYCSVHPWMTGKIIVE
jgi:plastocyanin